MDYEKPHEASKDGDYSFLNTVLQQGKLKKTIQQTYNLDEELDITYFRCNSQLASKLIC
jgi:hypothetical protein